jgi:hypothetical protein
VCGLPIRDGVNGDVPIMESVWEPTPAELYVLNNGGKIVLCLVGVSHPPVRLYAVDQPLQSNTLE